MKKFNRIKKINGKEYVYQITPYYDKETQQTKQKSKYLGIHIGDIKNPVKQKDSFLPKSVLDYGEYIPLLDIIKKLNIRNILKNITNHHDEILTIALNKIISQSSLTNIKSWYEGNVLCEEFGQLSLSSQNISKILKKIKSNDTKTLFCKNFIKTIKSKKTLFYDITSFSSYSKKLGLLEYGYNRDKAGLPQFNLSLIVDKTSQTPLLYDIYPGSVPDSKTVQNTIIKTKELGLKNPLLIMDRGFFTRDNIFSFDNADVDFIIGATTQLNVMNELFMQECENIEKPINLKKFNGKIVFVKQISVLIKHDYKENISCKLFGFMYHDPARASREKIMFYEILQSYLNQMDSPKLNNEKIKEISKKYSKYFRIENNKAVFNEIEITKKLKRMGTYIILSNNKHTWEEMLSLYKSKDMVEKGFHSIKNQFGTLPSNLQDEDTLEGLVFITFIALIIRMKLLKRMQDSGLIKKYSIDTVILELHKLKKISVGKKFICTEITKKQREILKHLECCA